MTVSTTTIKNSHSGNGTAHSFAYGFKIFADADLDVIVRSSTGTETVKTLNTDYIVTNAGSDSGGNVLFKFNTGTSSDAHFSSSDKRPQNGETVILRRGLDITQSTDYVANDPFPAESHENALDRLTLISQELQEELDRSIKLSRTNTMTSTEFTVGATDRASKVLAFDSSGEISVTQELGTFKGDWAASTAYVIRDIVKDTSTNNIFIVTSAHTSSGSQPLTTNANSAKYSLIVDAASATTSATNAASSATAAASSASAASSSQSAAASSATAAASSETAAASSQSAAASSATAAANAQAAAETALDTFDDRFLGAKSTNPSLDNDGNALLDGALYFDTTNDIMKVYDLTNNQWRQLTLTSTNQTNVNTVAGQISPTNNISTVAGKASEITTVAGLSADIQALADIEDGTTATDAISNVGNSITNVNTVASNLSGVNSFAERYRVQSGVPSSNNDVGDLVFDTAANTLKVFGSSGFQNAGSSVNGTSERFTYNITGTPSTLTGASGTGFAEANGNTLAYDAGFIDVYLNGVKMVNGTDVTVTSGTSVVFASALSNGDVVDIVTFGTFSLASINADNISSGTVPVARVSGSYTSITGTGALDAGSITSGFGNIDVGSSTITTTGAITGGSLAADGGITVDNITIDGTEIDLSSGDLTIDVAGDIILDADGGDIKLKDAGTTFANLSVDNSGLTIVTTAGDADFKVNGVDGSSNITALTLDMSEGGDATFNGKVIADTFTKSDDTNTQINFLGSDVTQFKNGNSESARFIQTTFFKQTNANGTYRDSTGQFNEFNTDRSGDSVLTCQMSHASYSGGGFQSIATRSATGDTYRLIECYSGNAADREFRVDSDGTVHADGSYTGTGADYAEMFEWKDGNTSNEDRVGKTVVLDGDKIRLSTSDDKEETIIGVVSATPVVLGDAQSEKWKEKYATDDYGRYIFEEYTQTEWIEEVGNEAKNFRSYNTDKIPSDVTVPKDAKVTSKDENGDNLKRRKLNSAFDASKTYIPREKRKEFSAIGLVGKLRVNVGQTVGDRWIKMREISDTVHEYLVR